MRREKEDFNKISKKYSEPIIFQPGKLRQPIRTLPRQFVATYRVPNARNRNSIGRRNPKILDINPLDIRLDNPPPKRFLVRRSPLPVIKGNVILQRVRLVRGFYYEWIYWNCCKKRYSIILGMSKFRWL